MKGRKRPLISGEAVSAAGFLTPSFVGLALFSILPIFGALVISLLDWDILTPPKYVGLANYATLWNDLINGETLRQVLANTVYFTAGTVHEIDFHSSPTSISMFVTTISIPATTSGSFPHPGQTNRSLPS